jgi:hypothetical protein
MSATLNWTVVPENMDKNIADLEHEPSKNATERD